MQVVQNFNDPQYFHLATAAKKFFQFYSLVPPFILEWDSSTETFHTVGIYCPRHLFAAFNIILVNILLTVTSCIYTLGNSAKVDISDVMFAVVFLAISYFDGVFSWSLIRNGELIALAFGRIKTLVSTQTENFYSTFENCYKPDLRWKTMVKIWSLIVYELLGMVIFAPVFLVIEEMDPYRNLFSMFIDPGWGLNIMKFILLGIYFIEATRLYAMYVLLIFYWLEMQSKCLEILEDSKLTVRCFIQTYKKFQICTQTWDNVFSGWVRLLLSGLFALITACCVATIKYVKEISVFIYWFPPSVAILDLATIYLVFPFITEGYERTERLLRHRKAGSWGKYRYLQMHALRPVSVSFGDSFHVTRKTKISFYNCIVERTMNGILL